MYTQPPQTPGILPLHSGLAFAGMTSGGIAVSGFFHLSPLRPLGGAGRIDGSAGG